MAKKEETLFKERVLKDLKALARTRGQKIQQVAIRATPDIICCINGYYVALELKTETGVIEPLQVYELEKLREARGLAIPVTPSQWEFVYERLRSLTRLDIPKRVQNLQKEIFHEVLK